MTSDLDGPVLGARCLGGRPPSLTPLHPTWRCPRATEVSRQLPTDAGSASTEQSPSRHCWQEICPASSDESGDSHVQSAHLVQHDRPTDRRGGPLPAQLDGRRVTDRLSLTDREHAPDFHRRTRAMWQVQPRRSRSPGPHQHRYHGEETGKVIVAVPRVHVAHRTHPPSRPCRGLRSSHLVEASRADRSRTPWGIITRPASMTPVMLLRSRYPGTSSASTTSPDIGASTQTCLALRRTPTSRSRTAAWLARRRVAQDPRRTDEWMPGEGKLHLRREDPHKGNPVGLGFNERGLGEPEFCGDTVHGQCIEPGQIRDDAEMVASKGSSGEDSDDGAVTHRSSVRRSPAEVDRKRTRLSALDLTLRDYPDHMSCAFSSRSTMCPPAGHRRRA